MPWNEMRAFFFTKDNTVLFVIFVLSEPGELAVVPSDPSSSLLFSIAKVS